MEANHLVGEDLKALVKILANWAAGHDCLKIFVFGSRVRGDHRPDSDVDVVVQWDDPSKEFLSWWGEQNGDEFRAIDELLPGKLQILENDDPICQKVLAAATEPILRDQNVLCVWLPPKPEFRNLR